MFIWGDVLPLCLIQLFDAVGSLGDGVLAGGHRARDDYARTLNDGCVSGRAAEAPLLVPGPGAPETGGVNGAGFREEVRVLFGCAVVDLPR